MRTAALFALLCLAGCVTTPEEVVERGQPHEFYRAAEPKGLANCTALNARSFSSSYTAFVNELVRPDHYQVVITLPRNQYRTLVVANTAPAPEGARLVIYTSDELSPQLSDDWIARLRKGC